MKYKIKNSDLFINNKLHPEGSEVELTKDQTKGIESVLVPLNEESLSGVASLEAKSDHSALDEESDSKSHPEPVVGSANEKEIKSKTKGNKK